ncbi:hypothetical protein Fcan01_28129 [Folsomia candida]|uniref:Uncharacterized protein n=1 Tax=Folsomia candida TaxID=158441 RepID=A0A226CWW6_FOLCA|nr:hypothetical protein Fcan01_28129 [Folsomia candida]
MPPVTVRDSGKGALYALGVDLKVNPRKLRNKKPENGNLNLVCPAKCHPLQLQTPQRARFTPLGHSYKSETEHFYDNFKGIRENSEIRNYMKRENLILYVLPNATRYSRDSGKGALYAPRPSYKSETEHFYDNFKGIRKNSEIPKLHEKGKLNLAIATKVKRSTFTITLKESEKTPKYRNYMKRENLNLVCPAKCHPLQLETPERARFTPLGHSYKSETEHFTITLKESEKTPKSETT